MLGYEKMLLVKSNIHSGENFQTVKFGTESLPGLSISLTALACEAGYYDIITADVNTYIILGNEGKLNSH